MQQHQRTHDVIVLQYKPADPDINSLTIRGFAAQSASYDETDIVVERRRHYTEAIDELIAQDLQNEKHVQSLLACACGTGRREVRIRSLVERPLEIAGVDITPEMCGEARAKGIPTQCSAIKDMKTPEQAPFDSATMLYSFNHLPSAEERTATLRRISELLRPGAPFWIDVFNIECAATPVNFEDGRRGSGLERGDLFIRKLGTDDMYFLHYFSLEEIKSLLDDTGFDIECVRFVSYWEENPGALVEGPDQGMIFIRARRR